MRPPVPSMFASFIADLRLPGTLSKGVVTVYTFPFTAIAHCAEVFSEEKNKSISGNNKSRHFFICFLFKDI